MSINKHLVYLELHLVQQRVPVKAEVSVLIWRESEGDRIRETTLGGDLALDGQRAFVGRDRQLVTAGGQLDVQAQGALAMHPDAAELQVQVILTWTWGRQKRHSHKLALQ